MRRRTSIPIHKCNKVAYARITCYFCFIVIKTVAISEKDKIGVYRCVRNIRAFVAILLLSAYAIGFIQVQLLHEAFHADKYALIHSAAHEKDPCHRTIYHDEKESSCEHKLHITNVEKCSLCSSIVHNEYLTFADSPHEFAKIVDSQYAGLAFPNLPVHSTLLPSRAPPAKMLF